MVACTQPVRTFALMLFLIICVTAPSFAGTTGVLNGYVRDYRGGPAAGAVVVALPTAGVAWARSGITAHADTRGFFVFLDLAPGVYYVFAWNEVHGVSARTRGKKVRLIFVRCSGIH
jgi:hypothetical protein